ncbi:MAG: rhomboid family intramembrane serine protease [Gammaproteobacteria bacterium]|jgi:GlpG protein|nr:rhomboid family intramembrane serine protease [Gammaproteobacteria bacterium]MBQ0773110.1 rhomboid family intramembrane serine protease [Gammaproteobacteria bacterium]|tara:strand:- start:161168 stop:162004 length:837 start_codon:yes stop_codon:yes gene_type:complete
MQELVRFKQAQPAHLLVQVMAQQGIRAEVEETTDGAILRVSDADQFDLARTVLEEFLANPAAPRFQQSAWQVSEPVALGAQPGMFTGDWWRSIGPMVKIVFVVCAVVFLSQWFVGGLFYNALSFPQSLAELSTQPWRLFTPALMHLTALHIIFNLLWWVDLGRIVERFQSSWQLLWLTLATAAASNLAQFYASGPGFGGLSGVVYGLLGYLWLYGKTNPGAGYGLRKEVVILMVAWLFICMTGFVGNIANTAHVVGLLSGCAIGAVTGLMRRGRTLEQ